MIRVNLKTAITALVAFVGLCGMYWRNVTDIAHLKGEAAQLEERVQRAEAEIHQLEVKAASQR